MAYDRDKVMDKIYRLQHLAVCLSKQASAIQADLDDLRKLLDEDKSAPLNREESPADWEYCPHCHGQFSFTKCREDFTCPYCNRDVRQTENMA
jgi:hypothetical protein